MHIEAMSTVVQQSLTVREDFEQQHEQTVREEIERFRVRWSKALTPNSGRTGGSLASNSEQVAKA